MFGLSLLFFAAGSLLHHCRFFLRGKEISRSFVFLQGFVSSFFAFCLVLARSKEHRDCFYLETEEEPETAVLCKNSSSHSNMIPTPPPLPPSNQRAWFPCTRKILYRAGPILASLQHPLFLFQWSRFNRLTLIWSHSKVH